MAKDKRILIVSSKWPGKTNSSDGGNSTVRELIEMLKDDYSIDILYFGENRESAPQDGIDKVLDIACDYDHYEKYSKGNESKFIIRLRQADMSAREIEKYNASYDRIIVIHTMFLMGINPNNSYLLNKVILFPMFTGIDYRKCGEQVPDEYMLLEKNIMKKVGALVVPSKREKETLTQMYDVNEERVHVIHRCVDRFRYQEHILSSDKTIEILFIASIRMQKAHIDSIILLRKLIDYGLDVKLLCIGAIQDKEIHFECLKEAKELNVDDRVIFTGNMEYDELATIISKADVNISVSQWETFGRGIFEGMAAGIPTLVLSRLDVIKDITSSGNSPIICDDLEEMACKIKQLYYNPDAYFIETQKGKILRNEFSTCAVKEQLINVLDWS